MGSHYASSAKWRSGMSVPWFPDRGLWRDPRQMRLEREARAARLALRYPMAPALKNAGYKVPVLMAAVDALEHTATVTEAATNAVDKLTQSLQQIEQVVNDGDEAQTRQV